MDKSVRQHLLITVPTMHSHETVKEAREKILKKIGEFESINYVYVLSEHETLVGVLSFRELFTKSESEKLSKVANKELVVSHPQVHQERIAHLALKHNIKSVPIVDESDHFLGIVPSDKILEILHKNIRKMC